MLILSYILPSLNLQNVHLSETLLTVKHVNFPDPDLKLCDCKKRNPKKAELKERLFYESFLPISTFIFLLEVNNMSENDVEKAFIEMVEPAMKFVLSKKAIANCKPTGINPTMVTSLRQELLDTLDIFSNFSLKVEFNKLINTALKKRNEYFEKDESQIARQLLLNEIQIVRDSINKMSNEDLAKMINIKSIRIKNEKYVRMIKALRKSIIETENLTKSIERERREFISEFKDKEIPAENKPLFEMKISFNLGGSIFAPSIFLQLIRDTVSDNKDDLIDKAVKAILRPIEQLELYTRFKSNIEKKEEIMKFLLACLEKRNNAFFDLIDDAFRMRSYVINNYLRDRQGGNLILDNLDRYQENYINNMIEILKKANEESLKYFLVLNDDVISAYKNMLRLKSKDSKNSLISLFGHNSINMDTIK